MKQRCSKIISYDWSSLEMMRKWKIFRKLAKYACLVKIKTL